jgi:hypothetical protein
MKITRSQLKSLIKEEMNRINETPSYVGTGTTGALVAKRQPGRYITREDFISFVRNFLPNSGMTCDAVDELREKRLMYSTLQPRPEDRILTSPPSGFYTPEQTAAREERHRLEVETSRQQNIFDEEAAQVEWVEELFFDEEANPCEERAWPQGQARAQQEWTSLVKTS